MPWHPSDARRLVALDQQLQPHSLRPAAYEIARRVVHATGDLSLLEALQLEPEALVSGAVALSTRCPLVVDVPAIQIALLPALQATWANPLYCALGAVTRPQLRLSPPVGALAAIAQRYPKGCFVIGQEPLALEILVALIERQAIAPALVIATPPALDAATALAKTRLQKSAVPCIWVSDSRGGVSVAIAIAVALIDLADQSYGNRPF